MARIIGQIGSLKYLKTELKNRNITRFTSIGDINRFARRYEEEKQEILNHQQDSLVEELRQINGRIIKNEERLEKVRNAETAKLIETIENHSRKKADLEGRRGFFISRFIARLRAKKINRKLVYLQENFDLIIDAHVREVQTEIKLDYNILNYLSENSEKTILERSKPKIEKIEHQKKSIDALNPLIAGAIGESLVEKEIRKLSDEYTLINDYCLKFKPPIYNKKTDDRIYSIQIDHLLISRSGLFILETKNWSRESIMSLDLRSPVDQMSRSNYALNTFVNMKIRLNRHHWGEKRLPIRSIIVMINEKPQVKFKYVKIKQLKELNSYIEYFDPIFSYKEVESVINSLINKGVYNTPAKQGQVFKMSKPSMTDWFKENPGKSINDYYSNFQ